MSHRLLAILLGCLALPAGSAQTQESTMTAADAATLGVEAYIYGYPLVTMEFTRRIMTNVATTQGTRGPMGSFINARAYPTAAFRDVTAPNADTLYSTAWLDLAKEPYILSVPDEDGRFYLMPLLSGWTDVFEVPGKRTTGTKAHKFALTGPGWKGTLPDGITEFKSPTNMVWILGRTYCTGTPQDYQAVHALQDQYSVIPLSAYGKPYTPPHGKVDPTIDMKASVRDQVHRMDAATYFSTLATLMKDNPPALADAPMVEKMAQIGIVAGKPFDIGKLKPAVAQGLLGVPNSAQKAIMGFFSHAGIVVNGWQVMTKTGIYGTAYLQRAFVTAIGLGANRPEDAVYPTSMSDADGNAYDGANKYVMHFPKGQTPPAKGFWSLTMYDANYFFVANSLDRSTVSSRFDFKYNADGSLDLYIQEASPGNDKESNWLPAPAGKFILMLRLYWPQETAPSIIDGSWKPPGVQKVK
jgi:hypothetical protein